ncbi:hypothetical protein ACWGB8_15870 [Kitasatospora sp. NPDC054939]
MGILQHAGADPVEFVLPLLVGLGSSLLLASALVALSPRARGRTPYGRAGELAIEDLRAGPDGHRPAEPPRNGGGAG